MEDVLAEGHHSGNQKNKYGILVRVKHSRWKVENECFNTLKNQGYSIDHNYGPGKKHFAFNLYRLSLHCLQTVFWTVEVVVLGFFHLPFAENPPKKHTWLLYLFFRGHWESIGLNAELLVLLRQLP